MRIEPINTNNIDDVVALLVNRNNTLPAYTRWKYDRPQNNNFRGLVVYQGEEPIGCFGVMPKVLRSGEEQIPCGWFADWYVIPSMQGSGLGVRLLKEITQKGYSLFFGHPGPKKASEICLQNGWQAIPFQSSRRFIVSPSLYFRPRSHYFVKRFLFIFRHYYRQIIQRGWINNDSYKNVSHRQNYFIDQDLNWLCSQPVNPKITRIYGVWEGSRVKISYCDDKFFSGETRRRILLIENLREHPQDILSFFAEIKKSNISFMDIFTTDQFTDAILAKAGAIKFKESPIVWYGDNTNIQDVLIEGVDRENWLYLAGNV